MKLTIAITSIAVTYESAFTSIFGAYNVGIWPAKEREPPALIVLITVMTSDAVTVPSRSTSFAFFKFVNSPSPSANIWNEVGRKKTWSSVNVWGAGSIVASSGVRTTGVVPASAGSPATVKKPLWPLTIGVGEKALILT